MRLNRFAGVSVLALAMFQTSALAQTSDQPSGSEAPAGGQDDEAIVVTGIRASLGSARAIKRDSAGIVDAISAQDIGKLPDTNLAESLQRITGVSIDRAGGEGQKITVRGFGPEFNTVLVNGRQIASWDATRAFSFDTLAAELVSGLEVFKSSNARYQTGGVGATVNIRTARPLSNPGLHIAAALSGTYDGNAKKVTPNGTFQLSNTFADDRFGVLLNFSYQRRKTELQMAQTDGWLNPNYTAAQYKDGKVPAGNIFAPRNFDVRVTEEDRERLGGMAVLQFQPSDDLKLTADALYSKFDVTSNSNSIGFWFTPDNAKNVVTGDHGTVTALSQDDGEATDMIAKILNQRTRTYDLGLNAEWQASDRLKIVLDGHYSDAKIEPDNGYQNGQIVIGYLNRIDYSRAGTILPKVSGFEGPNPSTGAAGGYLDPKNYRAHQTLLRSWGVRDKIYQFRSDVSWKGDSADSGLTRVDAGLYFSREEKGLENWNNTDGGRNCHYCGYPALPPVPAGTLNPYNPGSILSGVSGSGGLPSQWLSYDPVAWIDYLSGYGAGWNYAAAKQPDSFIVTERVIGGYLEANFAGSFLNRPISLVAGVRFEATKTAVNGANAPLIGLTVNDLTSWNPVYGPALPVRTRGSYEDVLPSMAIRWSLTDELTARFAASRTLTRPTLQALSPVVSIGTTRPGTLNATSGNAELQPFRSDNIDVSLEYYYGSTNYISLGAFYKNVSNFIVTNNFNTTFPLGSGVVTQPTAGNPPAVFLLQKPVNGPTARIVGLEAALQHSFGETGFGVQLNGTLVSGNKKLNPADLSQKFALTGLSNSANAVVYYDKGIIEARVAWNWRDKFLQSLTQPEGVGVTQVRAYSQFDASLALEVFKDVKLFGEVINIGNSRTFKYGNYIEQLLLAQDTGRRFNFGIRASF